MRPYVEGAVAGLVYIMMVLLILALTACAPLDYAGAGYVALGLALDAPHAAAQERARVVEDEIGMSGAGR